MKPPVTVGLGGGTSITGAADNLVAALADMDRTLFGLENFLGIAEPERCADLLDTTPKATSGAEKGLNELICKAVGIKLRIRRLDTEIINVFNRLGTLTEEVVDANQK